MINFIEKTISIKFEKQEWQKLQNETLMEAMKNNKQIQPNDLVRSAVEKVVEEEMLKLKAQVDKEYPSAYNPVAPNVRIHKVDAENFDATLEFTFYTLEELEKINYKNLPIQFEYRKVDLEKIENAFKKFVENYPVLMDVETPIQLGDIVTIAYQTTKEGQEDEKVEALAIDAKESNSFSINAAIIGKKVNETFELNDPKNVHWTITIKKVERKTPTTLTDENIHLTKIPEITSIEKLKERLLVDYTMDHASNELLRYYKLAMFQIGAENKVEFSFGNLEFEMMQIFRKHPRILPTEFIDKNIKQLLQEQDPRIIDLMIKVQNNAKYTILTQLTEFLITKKENIKITPEEAKIAHEHIMATNISDQTLTVEQMAQVLHTQKIALYLAKYNNPEAYELISKDLKLSV
ncbi:trigger factor-related chaperone [Mycoplasmopsis iners]|uniref:trigger factor-related chaperone n=1 Tax=Mycoplasmopsis iners TaxID=76630 RepID=UPI00049660DC|nr:hypothetical protein [Mycoplasmopsis iners]